jgi:hypothetical protein
MRWRASLGKSVDISQANINVPFIEAESTFACELLPWATSRILTTENSGRWLKV